MDASLDQVDLEALRLLKARYLYFVDTHDWAGLAPLFSPDATFDTDLDVAKPGMEPKRVRVEGGEIVTWIAESLDSATSVHHGHMPILELVSESEARGIWAMEDIVDTPTYSLQGWGHYHETYRKISGEWRFTSIHLTRLRLLIINR